MNGELSPGDVISFSAGDWTLNTESFRIVQLGDDRLSQVVSKMPHLATIFHEKIPIVISCYPTFLGNFLSAITCDTYLRQSNFTRALMLCENRQHPAIVLGQPLVVADLLITHMTNNLPFPKILLIGVGGYYCPKSLEKHLWNLLIVKCNQLYFLHAYGMAEADFAVFVGQRSDAGVLHYTKIATNVDWRINDGILELRRKNSEQWHSTGDHAHEDPEGISIRPGDKRLHLDVFSELERWTGENWTRRTGYIARADTSFVYQLRRYPLGHQMNASEMRYGEFFDRFGASFSDKPSWT